MDTRFGKKSDWNFGKPAWNRQGWIRKLQLGLLLLGLLSWLTPIIKWPCLGVESWKPSMTTITPIWVFDGICMGQSRQSQLSLNTWEEPPADSLERLCVKSEWNTHRLNSAYWSAPNATLEIRMVKTRNDRNQWAESRSRGKASKEQQNRTRTPYQSTVHSHGATTQRSLRDGPAVELRESEGWKNCRAASLPMLSLHSYR